VSNATLILILVVTTALAFDFTNGFHDTANAMATSIATGALKPKTAVALSAILNLIGAFLSVEVALTVTNAVIKIQDKSGAPKPEFTANGGTALLMILLAGLVGAIVWNLFTWLLGLPSSSSHALLGGMVGATMAGVGLEGVKWIGDDSSKLDGVVGKVVLPALFAPLVAAIVAAVGVWLVHKATLGVAARFTDSGFKWGQIGSASLVSLAHGTNDAQKTMGIITLALIGSGDWTDTKSIPFWVKLSAASAIALGTWLGGWRIIRMLGKGVVDIAPVQGMAAQSSAAATILASSQLGFALSTTHVATGSVVGSGLPRIGGSAVRWGVVGRMVAGWLITLPAAGFTAAVMVWISKLFGNGVLGAVIVMAILIAFSTYMWFRSRHNAVGHHNVNDDWEPGAKTATPSATDNVSVK
jgi:PiT family inorganic phosphate transporter